ncbi:Dynamin-like GTPase that mediates homotypic ER fusion, partial [Dissophora globulifera]
METPTPFSGASAHDNEHLPRLHLINEEKQFSDELSGYISQEWNLRDAGFNYNLAAVFGSQSTGKSTLLNRLFGTSFDVMSETARMQTTKGIWISKARGMKVLIMDVEGTDGRERGEDQDFERKSALFSLATSEVLIVNMWEHQVGLYNGANMGLLKTVFEVNLQLFGSNRGKEKTLLLFVIRDHVGSTPLANLANTLQADLVRIWHGLSKPEGLEDCKISDYFDFMFTTLPHKLLQPEKFESEVAQLRHRFTDPSDPSYVFQRQYARRVPADGLHVYAEAVWEKIMTNKDLDLPTQQELLAQFRCDEIANAAFAVFTEAIKEFRHPIEAGHLVDGLGRKMKEIRDAVI